jgi:hypothetical protein
MTGRLPREMLSPPPRTAQPVMPAIAETGCEVSLPAQGLYTGCALYCLVSLYKVRLTLATSGAHEALHTGCASPGTRKENRHQNRRVADRCGSVAGYFHTSVLPPQLTWSRGLTRHTHVCFHFPQGLAT